MPRSGARSALLLGPLLAFVLAVGACASGSAAVLAPKGLRGVVQSPGMPKPNFTLPDTSGTPFNLQAATAGDVTLLYFGYTHCPDVCPTHMANISAALQQLPPTVTSHVKVVFVTTDPARDTPAVLRAWLDHFDPGFIGLTGTVDQIAAAAVASGLPPTVIDTTDRLPDGSYSVDHAAQVDAFTTDNLDHVVYPSGYTEKDWVNDLPKLVKGVATILTARRLGAPALWALVLVALPAFWPRAGQAASSSVPQLEIADARAPAPASPDVAVVYLTVINHGSSSDRLLSASTTVAGQAVMHQEIRKGLLITMAPSGPVVIPAHKSLVLSVGGTHLMLEGLLRPLNVGDHFPVTFSFQHAGDLTVSVPVVAASAA